MLLTVLIVSGTIVGATTIAGLLMLYQLRQATNFGQSLQALFAADTGLEWKLYQQFQDADYPPPEMSADTQSSFVVRGDKNTSIISLGCAGAFINNESLAPRSSGGVVGCPRPITRAFELKFR